MSTNHSKRRKRKKQKPLVIGPCEVMLVTPGAWEGLAGVRQSTTVVRLSMAGSPHVWPTSNGWLPFPNTEPRFEPQCVPGRCADFPGKTDLHFRKP